AKVTKPSYWFEPGLAGNVRLPGVVLGLRVTNPYGNRVTPVGALSPETSDSENTCNTSVCVTEPLNPIHPVGIICSAKFLAVAPDSSVPSKSRSSEIAVTP